jgi:hypothetical protein
MEEVTLMEVCKYLNEVLEYYGPPCNLVSHIGKGLHVDTFIYL